MAETPIDTSPRRIWLGTTIPGKKLVRLLGYSGSEAGRWLNQFYRDDVQMVAMAIVLGLHAIIKTKAAPQPALRDVHKGLIGGEPYGAQLTDMRDFLKLRFRANGLKESLSQESINGRYSVHASPRFEGLLDASWTVNYMIAALDFLVRANLFLTDPGGRVRCLENIRDVCRLLEKLANPRATLSEDEELRDFGDVIDV